MDTFKVQESFGNRCDECGKPGQPGKPTYSFEVKGVVYTLCQDCYRLLIGSLYNANPQIFEELIVLLGKRDRAHILKLING